MKTIMRNLTGVLLVAAAALGTARPQSATQELTKRTPSRRAVLPCICFTHWGTFRPSPVALVPGRSPAILRKTMCSLRSNRMPTFARPG